MTDNLLARAGCALYGEYWQQAVARDLGISDRHIRRMAVGEYALKPGMALDLWRVALERAATLDELIEELKAASTPSGTGIE